MSQKNETPVLIVSLLLTLALLGAGSWFFLRNLDVDGLFSRVETPGGSDSSRQTSGAVADRLSFGDKLLIEGASADKEAGIAAFAAGNYEDAIARFQASLRANRNDPEALIYLNNARIGTDNAHAIAVSVPTATSVGSALEILRGVAHAQNDINAAGGINGVPLKILIASDDNDPEVSRQVARALVDDPTVLGVIGHFGSEATLAAAEIYQQDGLVMISPTSTSTKISELGDYIFRTVPSDRFTAAALSRYVVNQLQAQDVAIYFNSESDYSRSLKDEITTALYGDGGQVVGEFDLAGPAFDAAEAWEQATQQGAGVLVLAPNTATLDQALQLTAVNRRNLPLVGGDSVYNSKTLQVGGEMAVGMVVAVPWDILSAADSTFVEASQSLWGGDVNWRTAMAFDAAQVLIAGLERSTTRDGLQQAFNASGFAVSGATGTIRFLPSGDRNQSVQLVTIQPGSRSGYGYDFVSVP